MHTLVLCVATLVLLLARVATASGTNRVRVVARRGEEESVRHLCPNTSREFADAVACCAHIL